MVLLLFLDILQSSELVTQRTTQFLYIADIIGVVIVVIAAIIVDAGVMLCLD